MEKATFLKLLISRKPLTSGEFVARVLVMQLSKILTVVGVSFGCVCCGALDTINKPLDGDSDINPLDLPGSVRAKKKAVEADSLGSSFNAGDYVETSVPNSPFFAKFPGSGVAPTKVLAQGVVLRVVASEGAYLKVQNESGEEGYVANVMVVPQGLLVGGAPLPDMPPVVPGEVPVVDAAPEPELPGLEAPVPVDPSSPSVAPPIPPDPDAPSDAPGAEAPADKPADVPKKEEPSVAPEPELPGLEQ